MDGHIISENMYIVSMFSLIVFVCLFVSKNKGKEKVPPGFKFFHLKPISIKNVTYDNCIL